MKLPLETFLATATLCVLLASCAQTGAPLPPSLELPKPPTDLRATRKGNRVTLSWSEPTLTTDHLGVRYPGPTFVCRSPEADMTECGNPAATLAPPPAAPQKSASGLAPTQIHTDILPPALQQQDPAAMLTYAVEVLNRNSRGSGLSNRVHVSAIITLPPPSDLSAELTGDGVILTWTSIGESRVPANSPALQRSYRIYRREEISGKDTIAGEVSLGEPGAAQFTDSSFEWEKTYLYRITTVNLIKGPDSETQFEGDDTSPVRVIAHDIFPPSVPVGLQAAYSGEGQKPFVDLVWAPVTTSDLAGYNIYRSEAGSPAVRLNSELVKSPSYRDSAVTSGKTYSYSVSAVDVRGNESQHSEQTSETVP
jgi:hypothetical protein